MRQTIELAEVDEVPEFYPIDFNDIPEFTRIPPIEKPTHIWVEMFVEAFTAAVFLVLVVVLIVFADAVFNQ